MEIAGLGLPASSSSRPRTRKGSAAFVMQGHRLSDERLNDEHSSNDNEQSEQNKQRRGVDTHAVAQHHRGYGGSSGGV
jgi:hypothetical protein